jgi:hypothetical protein
MAVLFVILSNPAFAQQEPVTLMLPQGTYINNLNPALADVNQVFIVVTLHPADCDPNGLLAARLEQQVEGVLRKSGMDAWEDINSPMVKVLIKRLNPVPQGLKFKQALIPEFRVEGDILQLPDAEQCVFNVRVSLAKDVTLNRNPSDIHFLKADVWKKEPVMRLVASKDLADSLTAVVLEQVHSFIVDWTVEKQSGKRPDVNQPRPQLRKVTTEKDTKPAKQQAVEATFVASKNSEIFHKANCPSAKRISPNNLVSYATRDDAVAAGKKPCQRCNP